MTSKQLRALSAVMALLILFPLAKLHAAEPSQIPPAATTAGVASQQAVIDRYCVTCHNARNKANAGHLDLTAVDLSNPAQHAEVFEKVVAKLRAGLMPPAGQRRPDPATQSALVALLESGLDHAAETTPNPGRTEAFHRLNRAEYRNSVRDLLGVDLDVTPHLPSDDASFGFDNMAGVLRISQSRLEQYLAAARKISRASVGSPLPSPAAHEYRVAETANQYERVQGLPFGTRGGMLVRHHFAQDGEYELRIELRCRLGIMCDGSTGFADAHRMLVLMNGVEVKSFTLEPRKEFRPPEEHTWRVRLALRGGPHDLAVTFEKLPSIREVDSPYERFLRPYYLSGVLEQPPQTIYQPFLDTIVVVGPFNGTGVGQTPSRSRMFTCYSEGLPVDPEALSCATTIARTLARRAYRRPVGNKDVEPLLKIYRQVASERGFEAGIEAIVLRLLVTPDFLFRIESDPPGVAPGTTYRINDLELASRLSFFLWSSIPDEPLLRAAERGQLKNPAMLDNQVRRMLGDARADALIENFAGQWLLLRNLAVQRPDLQLFPDFDDSLRQAARRETELLFGSVVHENRSVLELLTADYTFVNERLARHYGIRGVYGSGFRRVKLPDDRRRGVLGHASILTVTSRPNRTSPVIRGKWILENVLGTPAPDPPANVPALPENENGARAPLGTMRERMMAHRANPICAGCHAMLEPPGLALENFDAVGKWRDVDESASRVDSSGSMPDGTKFDDLGAFRAMLLKDPEVFATTVTKKLMTYALGRGLEPYDMPAVRRIVRDATPDGLRLSAILAGIVRSVPFQMRRTASENR